VSTGSMPLNQPPLLENTTHAFACCCSRSWRIGPG
jgi:hypothetical protein